MDDNEFALVLIGQGQNRDANGERLRYLVADEMDRRVRELKERPDRRSRLAYAASQIRMGRPLSKRVMDKAAKDIAIVESRIVDGVPSAVPPYR